MRQSPTFICKHVIFHVRRAMWVNLCLFIQEDAEAYPCTRDLFVWLYFWQAAHRCWHFEGSVASVVHPLLSHCKDRCLFKCRGRRNRTKRENWSLCWMENLTDCPYKLCRSILLVGSTTRLRHDKAVSYTSVLSFLLVFFSPFYDFYLAHTAYSYFLFYVRTSWSFIKVLRHL